MNLFLCRVDHTSNYDYAISDVEKIIDESTNKMFHYPAVRLPIMDCTIKVSIFSPMTVTVSFDKRDVSVWRIFTAPNRFLPYYTTFGLAMFDDVQLERCFKNIELKKLYHLKLKDEEYDIKCHDHEVELPGVRRLQDLIHGTVGSIFNDLSNGVKPGIVRKRKPQMMKRSSSPSIEFDDDHSEQKWLLPIQYESNYIAEWPYCLLSNRENNFIPLVITNIDYNPAQKNKISITLIEKRSLALSLCHKFECLSTKDTVSEDECNNKNMAKGLLSVPEIIERLSIVPESEDEETDDTPIKNIVNFSAAGINRDKDKGPTDPKEQVEHCAFSSRFIAPSSQSRLRIIYSLARKYGYGLVYRPRSHQYYAIDLLGNTSPGFLKQTSGSFGDFYTFGDKDDEYYYGEYSSHPSNNIHASEHRNLKYLNPGILLDKNVCASFDNFFISRLLPLCENFSIDRVSTNDRIPRDYQYISRFSPLSSVSGLLQSREGDNKPNFNLTNLMPNTVSELNEAGKANQKETQAIYSFLAQHPKFTYKEGAKSFLYEDEVHSDIEKIFKDERTVPSYISTFQTVNTRLALAREKQDHLKNNAIAFKMSFYNNKSHYNIDSRPSHVTNLVYEILNRLGYYTTVFAKEAFLTGPKVKKRNKETPSGATHSIIEEIATGLNDSEQLLLDSIYSNNPLDSKGGSIFASAVIYMDNINYGIDEQGLEKFKSAQKERCVGTDKGWEYSAHDWRTRRDIRIVGSRYSTDVTMYFYNDCRCINSNLALQSDIAAKTRQKTSATLTQTSQVKSTLCQIESQKPEGPLKFTKVQKGGKNFVLVFRMAGKPKPADANVATNISKTDKVVEFDYSGKHYSYSRDTLETLCNYIISNICLNNNSTRREKDLLLAKSWQDPVLVIRTYMAYRRFSNRRNRANPNSNTAICEKMGKDYYVNIEEPEKIATNDVFSELKALEDENYVAQIEK